MTPRFRLYPAADRDVDEQAAYLAQEASLETAFRFYDQVFATLEALCDMPGIGERRESGNPRLEGLRVWRVDGFEKHLIFYREAANGIDVIRVLHGARDIARILEVESPDE